MPLDHHVSYTNILTQYSFFERTHAHQQHYQKLQQQTRFSHKSKALHRCGHETCNFRRFFFSLVRPDAKFLLFTRKWASYGIKFDNFVGKFKFVLLTADHSWRLQLEEAHFHWNSAWIYLQGTSPASSDYRTETSAHTSSRELQAMTLEEGGILLVWAKQYSILYTLLLPQISWPHRRLHKKKDQPGVTSFCCLAAVVHFTGTENCFPMSRRLSTHFYFFCHSLLKVVYTKEAAQQARRPVFRSRALCQIQEFQCIIWQ